MNVKKLEYLTKCRVAGCTKEFVSSPFDAEIIGQPSERIQRFVAKLSEHIQKQHPEQMNNLAMSIQQYMGFMILSAFTWEDPKLQDAYEKVRTTLHAATRKNQISDEDILDRVARLELDSDREAATYELLVDMRDLLTESGRYAPPPPEQKPLVVA